MVHQEIKFIISEPNDVIPAAEIEPQTNKVLILYPNGCKCMEKIVVLLAKALGQLGCTVLLDLYNTLEAAELGGREMYNTKKMSEAGRVLVVFSEGESARFDQREADRTAFWVSSLLSNHYSLSKRM